MTTFTPAPVYTVPPRKPIHPGVWIAALFGTLVLGSVFGNVTAKPAAAPTVFVTSTATTTTTATTTVTAQPKVSNNVALMEAQFDKASAADKESIRAPWRAAKGDATMEAYVISQYLGAVQKSIPSFTVAEMRIFLDYTLVH